MTTTIEIIGPISFIAIENSLFFDVNLLLNNRHTHTHSRHSSFYGDLIKSERVSISVLLVVFRVFDFLSLKKFLFASLADGDSASIGFDIFASIQCRMIDK